MSSDGNSHGPFSINDDQQANRNSNGLLKQGENDSPRMFAAKYTLKSKKKAIFEALTSFDINKLKSILSRVEIKESLTIT